MANVKIRELEIRKVSGASRFGVTALHVYFGRTSPVGCNDETE